MKTMDKKILIAIDLSRDSNSVIEAGLALAYDTGSDLHLIHVVEPLSAPYTFDLYANTFKELEEKAISLAKESLKEIANSYDIEEDNCHLFIGDAAEEIRNHAQKMTAKMIVIGSHGHSGWRLLLGSTANSLLHGAGCDVYTVHINS